MSHLVIQGRQMFQVLKDQQHRWRDRYMSLNNNIASHKGTAFQTTFEKHARVVSWNQINALPFLIKVTKQYSSKISKNQRYTKKYWITRVICWYNFIKPLEMLFTTDARVSHMNYFKRWITAMDLVVAWYIKKIV